MSAEVESNGLLAATAFWTAAVRAHESARADRLFDDPWAAVLAGEPGESWIAQRTPESVLPIALRTRFFDDYLQRVVAEEGIRQVILVAAGLDTRAFRLKWPPGLRLFELDQTPVLAYKGEVLRAAGATPTCSRRAVAVDLLGDWTLPLVEAGFAPHEPAVWLLEGLLFYLPPQELKELLEQTLDLAAPESAIAFDAIDSLTLTSPLTKSWVQMQAEAGAPWLGTLDDPEGLLARHGWQATLTALGAPDANYGRWPYPTIPARAPDVPHLWYVMGRKERGSEGGSKR
jgi:methyltransferase (TIGR00027 family)